MLAMEKENGTPGFNEYTQHHSLSYKLGRFLNNIGVIGNPEGKYIYFGCDIFIGFGL